MKILLLSLIVLCSIGLSAQQEKILLNKYYGADSAFIEISNLTNTVRIGTDSSNLLVLQDSLNKVTGFQELTTTTINEVDSTNGDWYTEQTLADDASYDLPDATAGFGMLTFIDATDSTIGYAQFYWDADGYVGNITSSSNVDYADTDVKFCIFDNGTAVRVRNRLGASMTVKLKLNW